MNLVRSNLLSNSRLLLRSPALASGGPSARLLPGQLGWHQHLSLSPPPLLPAISICALLATPHPSTTLSSIFSFSFLYRICWFCRFFFPPVCWMEFSFIAHRLCIFLKRKEGVSYYNMVSPTISVGIVTRTKQINFLMSFSNLLPEITNLLPSTA